MDYNARDRSARWGVLQVAEHLRVITRITEVLIVSNVASWIAIIILLLTKEGDDNHENRC